MNIIKICSSIFLLFFVVVIFGFCQSKSSSEDSATWQIAFKNDKQGNTVTGSRADLIQAIRNGCDIKIAWGSHRDDRSVEHISEPRWINIRNQEEVVAYLDPQLFIPNDKTDWRPDEWRVKITTGGAFDAIWLDRNQDTLKRSVPQQHTMAWMVRCGEEERSWGPFFK